MTLRYKLRTLLVLLAILPPLLWIGWGKYEAWRAEQEQREQATLLARQKAMKDYAATQASWARELARQAERGADADMAALQATLDAVQARMRSRDRPAESP